MVAPMSTISGHSTYTIQSDAGLNLLRISYLGRVTPDAMEACHGQVEKHLPAMRSGFTVLTDLSGLESMDLDCVAHLTKIMDQFRARGVGTVVRVVPDPEKDIGFKILSIVHLRTSVRVITCETLAEAERALEA